MLKINLVAMGDIKEKYLKEAIAEYSKRLSKFVSLNIIELKENIAKSNSEKDIFLALEKDSIEITKHLKGQVILLDIGGKELTSVEFSKYLSTIALRTSELTFVIGASNGLADSLKQKAGDRISFSKMTFPHQLMRVIFLEQLYRAFTIINNIAYHK